MIIKRVDKDNYLSLYKEFSKIKDFRVNSKVTFYELEEIEEWIKNPKENIFYAAFQNEKLVGFCFCKIMSNHWALIDNFYVKPEFRNKNIGKKIQLFIENKLKKANIKYISRVTRSNNIKMHRFLSRTGYSKRDSYVWYDKFL